MQQPTTRGGKTANFRHLALFILRQIFLFLRKPGSLEKPVFFYLNLLKLRIPS